MTNLVHRLLFEDENDDKIPVFPTEYREWRTFPSKERESHIILFREETEAIAGGGPNNAPKCPSVLVMGVLCDCPKTHDNMFGHKHMCKREAPCIVRAVLFPKGSFS